MDSMHVMLSDLLYASAEGLMLFQISSLYCIALSLQTSIFEDFINFTNLCNMPWAWHTILVYLTSSVTLMSARAHSYQQRNAYLKLSPWREFLADSDIVISTLTIRAWKLCVM